MDNDCCLDLHKDLSTRHVVPPAHSNESNTKKSNSREFGNVVVFSLRFPVVPLRVQDLSFSLDSLSNPEKLADQEKDTKKLESPKYCQRGWLKVGLKLVERVKTAT